MEVYEQNLHINDGAFCGMRNDADRVLQRLIKNMIEKDSMDGKITITIDVALTQEFILNRDPSIEGETRRVLTPKFSHKVGSIMQIKNEAKGDINYDGMELVWDEEVGEYVLKPIANTEQMTMFDADFRCVNDPQENSEEDEQPALEGRCIASLPGPVVENGTESYPNEPSSGEPEGDETEDMSEEFGEDDSLPFGGEEDEYGYEPGGEY